MIWPNYQSHTHISHEIDDGFELGNAYVSVRIDLLSRDRDGTYVISDWKTGEPRDSDEHQFQMNTYALYAHSKRGISEDSLQTKLVYLRTGDTIVSRPPKSELQSVAARITSEVSQLAPPIKISEFPAKPSHRLCISCSFLGICTEGKKHFESRKAELADLEVADIDID
jgi:RecB family exonuclease